MKPGEIAVGADIPNGQARLFSIQKLTLDFAESHQFSKTSRTRRTGNFNQRGAGGLAVRKY
jgi:hypothetical protein